MKRILLTASVLILLISYGFKSKNDLKISKTLLCKKWETLAKDDKNSKIVLSFNQNNTYTHEYVTSNTESTSKESKLILAGNWEIKEKNIYINFNKFKQEESFEIVSLTKEELVLNTPAGVKKFEICKN